MAFIMTYRSVFCVEQHAQWREKASQKYQIRKSPDGQDFFLSFFFFFFFRRASSNNWMTLSRWFSHKTAVVYAEQCTNPSLFLNCEVSQCASKESLKNYMASFAMPFCKVQKFKGQGIASQQWHSRGTYIQELLVYRICIKETPQCLACTKNQCSHRQVVQ